jgi:hypothetical protein
MAKPDNTLEIPEGCEEPAEVILTLARRYICDETHEEICTGGCKAFYAPRVWRGRGELYGFNSRLVVVHDGGDLTSFFDCNRENYAWIEHMQTALDEAGYFVEQCTCWYSAVYRKPHNLKVWPQYFKDVESGKKTFELSKDDRDYRVDDTVCLSEWDPVTEEFTNEAVTKKILYILRDAPEFGLQEGFCILSLEG